MGKRKGTARRQTKAARAKELAELLPKALTDEEIFRTLATVLAILKEGDRDRLVERLGPETGGALKRALESSGGKPHGKTALAGSAKVLEEWERAWSEWEERFTEAATQNGRYDCQEHHWEEPYLDTSALGSDLEPIAQDIRKLIPRVIEEDLAPDFSMVEAFVEDLEDVASSLPEWMYFEEIEFGPEATGCLLDWEWRAGRRDGKDAYDFALKIRAARHTCSKLYLDSEALMTFIDRLKVGEQKRILEGINRDRGSPEWSDVLSRPHSPWFRIFQDLSRRLDRKGYIESCRANLSRDWKLALPVIGDLAKKRDHKAVLSLAEEAAGSLLGLRDGESWDPRKSLLVREAPSWYVGERKSDIARLLRAWLKAAEALRGVDLASALRVQLILYSREEDWDAVAGEIKNIRSPRLKALRDHLYCQWRDWLAEKSVEAEFLDRDEQPATWVQGVVDSVWKEKNPSTGFRRFIEVWLREAESSPEALRRSTEAAALLTLDLGTGDKLRRAYPSLYRVLSEYQDTSRFMQAPRQVWLKRVKAPALLPNLIAFWKRNAARLVPDPARRPNDYGACADWLAAVRELDQKAFAQILAEWHVKHRRRRNLWKEVSRKRLEV